MITRRSLLCGGAAAGLAPAATIRERLPRSVPPAVAAILGNTLRQEPGALNTDWFGTLLMKGMLEWCRRGITEVRPFAEAWLAHHLSSGALSKYSGAKSRTMQAGGVYITTYAGHYGLAFPCCEMAEQFGDARARRVVVEIADIILHRSARNRFGMVAHDDFADFAIPDTCYFAVNPLVMAAQLEPARAAVYREQAVYQLRTYIDVFLMRDNGLVKTMLLKDGVGKTYWTRAAGWLLWSMVDVMRRLPQSDPAWAGFAADLRRLVEGVARVQDAGGGLHVFLNDPQSPLETTGSAMFAMGVHESVRRGWLPTSFSGAAERAWSFVGGNLTPEGKIRQAYTGYAVPAEQGVIQMDHVEMGWIPGFILSTACEMTAG